MIATLEQMQVPNGTGPGVRRSKRPLLASRTRCKKRGKVTFAYVCIFAVRSHLQKYIYVKITLYIKQIYIWSEQVYIYTGAVFTYMQTNF